jgi:hypothetical protein
MIAGQLPDVCVKTGAPTTDRVGVVFTPRSGALAVVAITAGLPADLDVAWGPIPLSAQAANRLKRINQLTGGGLAIGGLTMLFVVAQALLSGGGVSPWGVVPVAILLVVVMARLFVAPRVGIYGVYKKARGSDPDMIEIQRAHPAFIAALPQASFPAGSPG